MKRRRFSGLVLALALVGFVGATAQAAAGAPKTAKVDVCHATGDGSFHLINIADNAVAAHVASHGDGFPLSGVPTQPGYWFDAACGAFNTPPQVADQTFSVAENSLDGTVVGTIEFGDPDEPYGDVATITAVDAAPFGVDGSGRITVANTSALDYETVPQFEFVVTVSDIADETTTATITVEVLDVVEGGIAIVTARSVDSDGEEHIIAQIEDSNGDTVVSVGDTVRLFEYPRFVPFQSTCVPAEPAYGAFNLTQFEVDSVIPSLPTDVKVTAGGFSFLFFDRPNGVEVFRITPVDSNLSVADFRDRAGSLNASVAPPFAVPAEYCSSSVGVTYRSWLEVDLQP